MKILFHLGHPAHYHLFKNVIKALKEKGHLSLILIKKKDLLEELLKESGFEYQNILPDGRKDSKLGIAIGQIKQGVRLLKFCKKNKPELLIGSTPTIAHVGKLLNIPSINLSEDDAKEVMLYAKSVYPFTDVILSPTSCNNDKWEYKSIKHKSYHELAYLHPNQFTPDINIINNYLGNKTPFILMRFAKLNAYHDTGIGGINSSFALELIELLQPYAKILISSEKKLIPELEQYRIKINPNDIHHFLAYAKYYIGDSQTMAVESGVLGTPFIRINDFVDRIGILNELENKYQLGYGVKPKDIESVFNIIRTLLNNKNIEKEWSQKRDKMLEQKIDFTQYLIELIENYPAIISQIKKELKHKNYAN